MSVDVPDSTETEVETEESCPELKDLELKRYPVRSGVLLTGRSVLVCVGVCLFPNHTQTHTHTYRWNSFEGKIDQNVTLYFFSPFHFQNNFLG